MNDSTATDQPLVLIKYGGNAMRSEDLQRAVIDSIRQLRDQGRRVVVVHGGGPFIKRMLETVKIESEFIEGHRKTTPEALKYIEMALKGEVNGRLVSLLNQAGQRAVGLSGKDGKTVEAVKRYHIVEKDGKSTRYDLGQVGDVAAVDTTLIELLLDKGYLPVITCIASDKEGRDFNINGDMFAGHLAGALKVDQYLVLTDVDGLMRDIRQPDTLIPSLPLNEMEGLFGSVIKGGMIPKMESCQIALEKGAKTARIINGTKPEQILDAVLTEKAVGTNIYS